MGCKSHIHKFIVIANESKFLGCTFFLIIRNYNFILIKLMWTGFIFLIFFGFPSDCEEQGTAHFLGFPANIDFHLNADLT